MSIENHDQAVTQPLPRVPSEFVAIGPPLARGASAVVWRARNRVTGRDVALKVWRSPLLTEQQRSHFEAESRRHLDLPEHPHIVRWLWAAAPADGPPWLATELHGGSLGEHLRREGPYPLATGLVIALDLLDGLAAMHHRDLVHRDVKPDNVVVTAGRAALCDLGVSVRVTDHGGDRAAGTRPYLAPELTDGNPDATADFRSDVYSAARTIRQTLGTDVPLTVDQLLTRAQSTAPADRPEDAGDFAARLTRVTADLGFGFRPGAAGAPAEDQAARRLRPGHRLPRRRVSIGLLTAALLLIGACAAVAVLRSGTPATASSATTIGQTTASQQTRLPVRNAAGVPALPAAGVAPDIDAYGHPVLLDRRPDVGRCHGTTGPGASIDQQVGGVTVATTTLYRDRSAGKLCAYFRKAGSDITYDRST